MTWTNGCAAAGPPVMVPAGTTSKAGAGARAALPGSDPNPADGRFVACYGWPLYSCAGDTRPGEAVGQALDMDGGLWYLIRLSGTPVRSAS